MRFFSAFDIDRYQYLSYDEFSELLRQLDLPGVPVLTTSYVLENDIAAIVRMATIRSQMLKEVWAEGIVIRPYTEQTDMALMGGSSDSGRVSFKAINPEFLLKYGE